MTLSVRIPKGVDARPLDASADRKFSVRLPRPGRAARAKPLRTRPDGQLSPWQLANGLKPLMARPQQQCRLINTADTVQLVEHSTDVEARLSLNGVATCKSPLCALCAPKWQRTRSDEISRAIDNWEERGAGRVFFPSLTWRHNPKMDLALQHRLGRHAHGNLWSGRKGQAAAAALGGKPESIRAHDRTWSNAHGWHPHIHALLFLQGSCISEGELFEVLDERWRDSLVSSLRAFKRLPQRILTGRGCKRDDCSECTKPPAERDECPHLRDRATRMFGVRLVPRWKNDRDGRRVRASLHDSMRRIELMLRVFTEENIKPSRAHGVHVERVRDTERVSGYLSKLGLELAASASKEGKEGSDGLKHFGQWAVAQLACDDSHPLYRPAQIAWRQLFQATRGTQTITFSSRERLGLDADPYAEGEEPPEAIEGEVSCCIGEIDAVEYRKQAKAKGHALIGEIGGAYAGGNLDSLPYVKPVGNGKAWRRSAADPMAVVDPGELTRNEKAFAAGVRHPRDEALHSERMAAGEQRGRVAMADGWREATVLPEARTRLPSEIARDLAVAIGGKRNGNQ